MKATHNTRFKQEKELSKISPLIQSIGYTPDYNMCGDRPDICIPSCENKIIGIEVTDYAERYYPKGNNNEIVRGNLQQKARKDFDKIMESYADYFDQRKSDNSFYTKELGYRITIWFCGGLFPYQDNLSTFKEIIYKEIDSFLFPTKTFLDNKSISDARADIIPNASKSIIDYQLGFVECLTPVDDNIVSEIIKEKNDKLLKYKECKGNESIKEYWLAICLPYQIQFVFENNIVESDIQTNYDKIFFVQDCKVWQVK